MDLEEFLYGWVSAEDLKDLLYHFGLPVSGTKDVLVSRLVEYPKLNTAELILLLKKPVIENALDRHGLDTKGTRAELAISLIAESLVEVPQKDIVRYVEGLPLEEFVERGHLVILVDSGTYADRILKLVRKFGRRAETILRELIKNLPREKAVSGLVKLLTDSEGDIPALAASFLEEILEEHGSVKLAEQVLLGASDSVRARQRRIQRSFEENTDLEHPAVDSLLVQVWSGQHRTVLQDWTNLPPITAANERRRPLGEARDYFIAHASEDKNDVGRPLAEALSRSGCSVWFDEYELSLGDSLREKIDEGLAKSRFGIVILSDSFFKKNWPRKELDGLLSKEITRGEKVVLPIRHGMTVEDVQAHSPILAGKLSVSTDSGITFVVGEVLRASKRNSGR